MTDAKKLAESLLAMRRNARMHYVAGGSCGYAIAIDHDGMLDLTEAATMLNVAAAAMAELAEWRSVFGHLGATPDDCGNAIGEARRVPRELLTDSELRAPAIRTNPVKLAVDAIWANDGIMSANAIAALTFEQLIPLVQAIESAVLAANGKTVP